MSQERIDSLSSHSSDDPSISQATAYPAKRVESARLAAALPTTVVFDSAPNSQESHFSASSKGSGFARLASDSSDLSNISIPDTESTSPVSLYAPFNQRTQEIHLQQAQRPLTPEVRNSEHGGSEPGTSNSASPVSVDSQHLKQGSKRMASGAVKPSVVGVFSGPLYSHAADSNSLGKGRNPSRVTEVGQTLYSVHCRPANHFIDILSVEDASFLCNGQGTKRLGESLNRAVGDTSIGTLNTNSS